MPDSPYLVTLVSPENAPATIILPNGQHYIRAIDPTTEALAATVEVWDHDVEAMKALGFREPDQQASQEQPASWAEPPAGSQSA